MHGSLPTFYLLQFLAQWLIAEIPWPCKRESILLVSYGWASYQFASPVRVQKKL